MTFVLLLAHVFEKFRINGFKMNYESYPSHYLSAPGLKWDAILKMTKIELELIPDPQMYIFFEKEKRGEISYITKIYSKANNKCFKSYYAREGSKHIIYEDTNNLYGYATSNFLPKNRFKCIQKNLTRINILAIVQKDVFSKLILNIQNNYKNHTMIIF